jgi:hypothetical protein
MEPAPKIDQATTGPARKSGRWLPGHSGNLAGPSIANPRIAELFNVMLTDFAEGELTGVERLLLRQAAVLLARAEKTKSPDISVRASSVAQRMLASVRAKKRSKPGRPPLSERLMAEHAE